MKNQYSTRGLMAGTHRCRFCGSTMASLSACKCSLKIKLTGHPDVIEAALGQLDNVFEIIEEDGQFSGGIKTAESWLDVVVKSPVPEAFLGS